MAEHAGRAPDAPSGPRLRDKGMFVPARTLSVAAMRMDYEDHDGADVVQVQFLRSLNN